MSDLDLTSVRGIGSATARILAEQGLSTARAVVEAPLEALLAVPGFGRARAKAVKAAATPSLARQLLKSPRKPARQPRPVYG